MPATAVNDESTDVVNILPSACLSSTDGAVSFLQNENVIYWICQQYFKKSRPSKYILYEHAINFKPSVLTLEMSHFVPRVTLPLFPPETPRKPQGRCPLLYPLIRTSIQAPPLSDLVSPEKARLFCFFVEANTVSHSWTFYIIFLKLRKNDEI